MSDISSVIRGVAVPLAAYAVFALARRYLKPAKSARTRELPIEQLNQRFRTTQWFVGRAMLLLVVITGWAGNALLSRTNRYFAIAEGPARFVLLPSSAIWWFLPGFFSAVFAWDLTLLFWSWFGDAGTIRQYVEWSDRRTGFDSKKVLHWMAVVIVLPIGVLTLLALPMHATLHEDEMRIREYAKMTARHYRYSQARRLSVVQGIRLRDGKFEDRAAVLIDFSDGRRWSSADNRDFTRFIDPEFVVFLSRKTGLPVTDAETEADIPK